MNFSKFKIPEPKRIQFYAVIIVMVFVDLIILIIWMVKDPMKGEFQKLPNQPSQYNDDTIYEPRIRICKCGYEYIWIGMMFSRYNTI